MAAILGPGGPSMATSFAADGPGGPVVAGDQLRRDRPLTAPQMVRGTIYGSRTCIMRLLLSALSRK